MNIEKYLEQLETKNRSCRCTNLKLLFTLRKKINRLKERCEYFFTESTYPNIEPENREFNLAYHIAYVQLNRAEQAYTRELGRLIDNGELSLMLHNGFTKSKLGYITLPQARKSVNDEDKDITIHCSNCLQQIDFLDACHL